MKKMEDGKINKSGTSGSPDNPGRKGESIIKTWLSDRRGTLVVVLGFYILLAAFFAPVVFRSMGLSPAADMVASAGMYKMGEEAIRSGRFPLWNTTLFCGLPMFASLQYALFTYPPEFLIRGFSYIFGFGDYRIWVFHYLLAGLFTYLLARHFKCSRLSAWLAGAAYAFSPQLIVLADVGHGSKLMAMTWLPLIWLMMDRLRVRPSIGRAAALGAVFAVEILALHPQVAAYGAMIIAVYIVYFGVSGIIRKNMGAWGRLTALTAGAMILSLALSAVLWVSVLDYARFSIRGASGAGIAGAGVGWEYATGWSFHPLESITFLFPKFMGFGGSTYWGTVGTPQGQPFTHNPMYLGIVVVVLAVFCLIMVPRKRWGFAVTLAVVALTLSFGKYLPLIYGPFFHFLPFFNKFRAPVMGQVLFLLPMSLLAGIGFEALIGRMKQISQKVKSKGKKQKDSTDLVPKSDTLLRIFWWTVGVSGLLAVLFMVSEDLFSSLYHGFAEVIRPGTAGVILRKAEAMARPDVIKGLMLIAFLAGVSALALRRKIAWKVVAVIFIGVLVIDLWMVNYPMINFTSKTYGDALFQPEPLVNRMLKDPDRFRIHPIDSRYRAVNWWSYFGLESTTGYFGAKHSNYQKLMTAAQLEGWGALFSRPRLLDAMNVRYIISGYPIDQIFAELKRQGRGEPARSADEYRLEQFAGQVQAGKGAMVYRNLNEMPRVRLVDEYRVIPDIDATFNDMIHGEWDPRQETLLEKEPQIKPQAGGVDTVKINSYHPEEVIIKVSNTSPKLLILADTYYPSGWTASVDGEEVEILRADGVFRAVAVAPGDHLVEFVFKPKWFFVGMWVSIVTVLLLLGWFVYWMILQQRTTLIMQQRTVLNPKST